MTPAEISVRHAAPPAKPDLELVSGDGEYWRVVPADASDDVRARTWLAVDGEMLCDLDAWR